MTNADIVRLTQAGIGEAAVVEVIGSSETDFDTTVDSLVALAEAGVGDAVIAAMAAAGRSRTAAQPPSAPVPTTRAGDAAFDSADRAGPHGSPESTFRDASGSGSEGAAADYSKCADFLNVEPPEGERRGYAIRATGPFLENRVYYYPFRLEADGEIIPNPHGVDGVRHTTRVDGRATVHVFEYPLPSLADLQGSPWQSPSDVLAEISSKTDRIRKAVVTVTQRRGTMEIVEDFNLGPDERREAPAVGKGSFGESELENFVPAGTRTVFDIDAGECAPRERSEILVHRDDPHRRTEILSFHMPLCRGIKVFIDGEPGVQGVFDDDVNSAMWEVFDSHNRDTRDGFEGLTDGPLTGFNVGQIAAHRFAYTAITSLEILHFSANFSYAKKSKVQRELSGFSPVIAGHMALAWCYVHGLWGFLQEPADSAETADGTSHIVDPAEGG